MCDKQKTLEVKQIPRSTARLSEMSTKKQRTCRRKRQDPQALPVKPQRATPAHRHLPKIPTEENTCPVSYTHLDVYKRQV